MMVLSPENRSWPGFGAKSEPSYEAARSSFLDLSCKAP
jgi:hypothetical protein